MWIDTPHKFIPYTGFTVGIYFKFPEKIIQKCTFPAAGRTNKYIDFILLGTLLHILNKMNQPVCKKSVSKKRSVRFFFKKPAAIIIHIMNRFRVIGILIKTVPDIPFNHVMEYLENITQYNLRFRNDILKKSLERYRRFAAAVNHFMIQIIQSILYSVHIISCYLSV